VIPKHLLVNQILEKSQLLVHRLIVVPMKVAMTMKIMNKNNLQIYTYFFLSCSKKYINPAQIFFFSINTSKNKSRELCLLCCFSSCCSYYSYFLMLLYISCVPVSWSYMCVLFFFVLFAIVSQISFIHFFFDEEYRKHTELNI
jgi:hypothetical protein